MPDINQWSRYGRQMPTEVEQAHWLASYPTGNIGLPLGPESGVCVIDIDTDDAELDQAIRDICGPTPWVRVGKKGAALAYKFEGQKNFKLRRAEGGMICEFLGLGNQVVLPPSIHPDTQQPYTAAAPLWEVLDQLPCLGEDIEDKLRALLGTKGYEIGAGGRSSPIDIVPAGERDVQMVRHAGYLARVVLGIDRSASFSLMEAMGHMYHWVENYTAKVSGDAMDPEKGVAKLLEFLVKDLEKGKVLPEGWDAGLTDDVRGHPTIARILELNEFQSWDLARMLAELRARSEQKPKDPIWLDKVAGEIVREAASDPSITEYDIRCFHERLHQAYDDATAKWGALKQVFKANRQAGLEADALEDHHAVACAVLEDLERSGEIRCDHTKFWQWGGSCWSALNDDDIYMHVAANVKGSAIVKRDGDYSSIVRLLRKQCRTRLAQRNIVGVNFANGFVTDELAILPHDPDYGCTFTLPFNYEPELANTCTGWLRFLESCWGQAPDYEDRVLALQEAFAATVFKLAPEYQRAFLLYGLGGSGKSQVLNVLRAMLPPAAVASLGPEVWGDRFHLTHLIGTAANICGELPEQGRIKGSIFKQVIEGSPIYTEYKNQDGFNFEPQCAHWFASNFLPISPDSSYGFARRWMVFDFQHKVADDQKVPDLALRLISEEQAAIAAWAVEGVQRLREQKDYTQPASHLARVQQMRRLNNSVLAFLEDTGCVRHGNGSMPVRELYDIYRSHMGTGGYGEPVRHDRFKLMLEELGHPIVKHHDAMGYPVDLVTGMSRKDFRKQPGEVSRVA